MADAARHLRALADPALRARLGAQAERDARALFATERYHDAAARYLRLPPVKPEALNEQYP